MTPSQIGSNIMHAVRMKLHEDQVLQIMDACQHIAFDYNSPSFLVWNRKLTPNYELNFSLTAAYTDAVAAEVGLTVLGATSGATAVLLSYDESERRWQVDTVTGTFVSGEVVTANEGGGTGTGTLADEDFFETSPGPYDAPTDPPCRKIWGVTLATDGNLLGITELPTFPLNDYDFLPNNYDPSRTFKQGRVDDIEETFTFGSAPDIDTLYRFIYWRDSPTVNNLSDASGIILPSRYHMSYTNACIRYARGILDGEPVSEGEIKGFFEGFHDSLHQPFTPMGTASNGILDARRMRMGLLI